MIRKMPRRVEDIVRSDKRSIRSIESEKVKRAPARTRASAASEKEEEIPIHRVKTPKVVVPEEEEIETKPEKVVKKKSKSKSNGTKIWLISGGAILVIVIVSAFVASTYFSRAKFTIVPITIPINVNNMTIVATASSSPNYLRYEVITVSGIASSTIPATDGPYLSSKATGSVTIYNAFSTTSSRLIAGTRLSNEQGKVYRLSSSLVIPGYKTVKGVVTPGMIKAAVVADEPGAEFNMAKSSLNNDLHIVAYSGGPRYDSIYAKLASDITGGYVGTKKTVNPAVLATSTKEIQTRLTSALLNRALGAIKEGYIAYPSGYSTSFQPASTGGLQANSATVSVTGSLYLVIFKKTDLVTKLAGPQKMMALVNSPFKTDGLEKLSFTISNPTNFNPAKGTALIARLNGDVSITGIVPVEELRAKLAGMALNETKNVLMSYSSVIDVPKSSGELFPSWASGVPKDQERILINLEE